MGFDSTNNADWESLTDINLANEVDNTEVVTVTGSGIAPTCYINHQKAFILSRGMPIHLHLPLLLRNTEKGIIIRHDIEY